MARTRLTYHLFDIGGMYIDTFTSPSALAKKIGGETSAIRNACKRGGCLYSKYYVSSDRNFDVNKLVRGAQFNPILSLKLGLGAKFRSEGQSPIHQEVDEFFRNPEDYEHLYKNH